MNIPTIQSFLTECLIKNGHNVDIYHLSDNSGSGITIKRERDGKYFLIEIQFDGAGLILEDIKVYERKYQEVDQNRIL